MERDVQSAPDLSTACEQNARRDREAEPRDSVVFFSAGSVAHSFSSERCANGLQRARAELLHEIRHELVERRGLTGGSREEELTAALGEQHREALARFEDAAHEDHLRRAHVQTAHAQAGTEQRGDAQAGGP